MPPTLVNETPFRPVMSGGVIEAAGLSSVNAEIVGQKKPEHPIAHSHGPEPLPNSLVLREIGIKVSLIVGLLEYPNFFVLCGV